MSEGLRRKCDNMDKKAFVGVLLSGILFIFFGKLTSDFMIAEDWIMVILSFMVQAFVLFCAFDQVKILYNIKDKNNSHCRKEAKQ